jgi:hypothetical protein
MHAHPNRTDDKNHIANILFIEAGCFTQAMRDSRLTTKSGDRISYNNFDMLLGFTTYFDTIYPVKDSEVNSKVSIKLKVFKFYDSNSMVPENIEGPFAETLKVRKLRIFSRVGPNREDPIEHVHQVQHRERIKASNIRNHSQMQQTIDRRVGAMNIPAVAENVAAMTTIRKLSRTSLEKRSEKESIKKIIKN